MSRVVRLVGRPLGAGLAVVVLTGPTAAMAADPSAPCLAEVTSANAVATSGEAVRDVAVEEGQTGATRVVVPTLAQSADCPD